MPSNIFFPTSGSDTIPNPTKPLPDFKLSGNGLNPKADVAAGQDISSPVSTTLSPLLASPYLVLHYHIN